MLYFSSLLLNSMFLTLLCIGQYRIIDAESCTPLYNDIPINEYVKAPDFFVVDMYMLGFANPIVMNVNRSWSPIGVDHFYALLRDGFYSCAAFYTVIDSHKPKLARTGFSADPSYNNKWDAYIADEDASVKRFSNVNYTIKYDPTSGYGTRSTFFSINMADNSYLDDSGYYPFAIVVDGIDTLKQVFSYNFPAYGDFSDNDMDEMAVKGNEWLLEAYKDETVRLIEKITVRGSSSSSDAPSSGSWAFSVIMIIFSSAAIVYGGVYIYRRIRKQEYDTMLPGDSEEKIVNLN